MAHLCSCFGTGFILSSCLCPIQEKAHVNVGYWAGLVPENAHSPAVLTQLLEGGALGFKSFMSPSGIHDFPNVAREDVVAAVAFAKASGVPYYVHAEIVSEVVPVEVSPE